MANQYENKIVRPEDLTQAFIKYYGGTEDSVSLFASPARINIIGEHIDYNGGKVFPAAIDRYMYVAIRKRNDTKIVYNDLKFPGTFTFDINDNFAFAKENDYSNYLNGILSIIKRRGYKFDSTYTKRIVYDMNQLREKLMILDAGLDDHVIELMKVFIMAEILKHKPEHQIVDFFFHTENGENSFAIRFDNDTWGSTEFIRDSYNQIADQFKTIIAVDDDFIIDSEWAVNTIDKQI